MTSARIPGAGRRVTTLEPGLPQPPGTWPPPVATSSAVSALGPLDDQIEVRALPVRLALAVGLGPLAPDVAVTAASSTARRAASSIVGST